ncbi:MAG: type II toxin-antitoxin system RelE/ParE family toxin [Crocinitomicaceae bacterium]|nr:type II toxin-antitoxin system RelE/ParE family toxin [Crocinitomicaceae bacterium]
MIVRTDKTFLKDYRALKKFRSLLDRLEEAMLQMEKAWSPEDLPSIKHIEGTRYRMRIGGYRLGFRLESGEIVLERFLHRKEIYRRYPPK